MCAKSVQSCPTLCDPMDYSQPGSSVHGILQERILEWVAISFSMGSTQPRDRTYVSYFSCTGIGSRFSTTSTTWEAPYIRVYIYIFFPQSSSFFSTYCMLIKVNTCRKRNIWSSMPECCLAGHPRRVFARRKRK